MSGLKRPPHRRNVREIETLEAFIEHGGDLREVAVQGVDLTAAEVDWDSVDVRSTLFLGCRFPSDRVQANLQKRGRSSSRGSPIGPTTRTARASTRPRS